MYHIPNVFVHVIKVNIPISIHTYYQQLLFLLPNCLNLKGQKKNLRIVQSLTCKTDIVYKCNVLLISLLEHFESNQNINLRNIS